MTERRTHHHGRRKTDKSPAFQFYVKDILSDAYVMAMELDEFGAYIRLMSHIWNERGLENNPALIAKLLRARTSEDFERIWSVVQARFYLDENGHWQHQRLDKERAKQRKYRTEKQKAARARWDKEHAGAMQVHPSACAPHEQCNALPLQSASAFASAPSEIDPGPAKPAGKPHLSRELVEHYKARFLRRYESEPVIDWKRDTAIMAGLLKQKSQAEIATALDAYFDTVDSFIGSSGHTLTFFRSQFNRIVALSAQPPIATTTKTAGNRAVLERFVQRKMAVQ